uniref:Uncharacterized protein n=1 Tax=Daphnia galeata TaxID=27404 RepID=A0A8J2RBM4_9CRUS|nr:unnamed protein product [Daphnia galeata]
MKIWPPARLGVTSVVTVIVIKNENDIARQVGDTNKNPEESRKEEIGMETVNHVMLPKIIKQKRFSIHLYSIDK